MNDAATFEVMGKVVVRRIGADRLLVPVLGEVAREGCVFPVNATGEFIWMCLAKGQTLGETAAAVAAEFAVTPAAAHADCGEFAAQLVAQRLLEVAG